MPMLEEVFRLSGTPTHTYVEPARYSEIMVSVRTPGRCLVIEGPSGIGKTTSINKVIDELGLVDKVRRLSARRSGDLEVIAGLSNKSAIGTVIVDDFHRLSDAIKNTLADFMKLLADEGDATSKLILIGINKAGQQLVKFAPDLGSRIDVLRFEPSDLDKIIDLIEQGEAALNIAIPAKKEIAKKAAGSFQITQLLCHKACTSSRITESPAERLSLAISIDLIIEDVMADLDRSFKDVALGFAQGSKLRKEGRAPYLHILKWLAESSEWSLDIDEALNLHPNMKGSIRQVIDKGYLRALIHGDDEKSQLLGQYFHFEPTTSVLSVEDPQLVFYLKNLVWRAFTIRAGFSTDFFEFKYDYALSFAGTERKLAQRLSELLREREVEVFYDRDLQPEMMGHQIEKYLAPIYRSEARYVVPFLSRNYPNRIWTKFESDHFKERFGENAVFPIRFSDTEPGFFSDADLYASLTFDMAVKDVEGQLRGIADVLCARIVEDRKAQRKALGTSPS